MRRRATASLAAALLLAACGGEGGDLEPRPALVWEELAALPDPVGVAGGYAGVAGGALLVAGGASFPDGRPWEGAPKVWHDRISVLGDPAGQWTIAAARLPRPLAYGVSVTWRDRVVCVAGGDAIEHVADCFALGWEGGRVTLEELPQLPAPAAFLSGALVGDVLHVVGGASAPDSTESLAAHWALDLSSPVAWSPRAPLPGGPRELAVCGAVDGRLLVFGGVVRRADDGGGVARVQPYARDAWAYAPSTDAWERLADLPAPRAGTPSPAPALGPAHLLLLGGDDGTRGGAAVGDAHPGFDPGVLAYNATTDTWTGMGELPVDHGPDPAGRPELGVWAPVTTPAVTWNGAVVLPSGEARPGVRTPRVLLGRPDPPAPGLGVADTAVLVVYLLALVLLGAWFARRERGTEDFFLGGRRVPWWAAGASVFATQLSAITFLAVPAKTYATDWLYLPMALAIPLVAPIVVAFYLPFFRRLNVTSAYEYLELRFSLAVRWLGSASFVLFQLGRMGIVVFLPALALEAVTGLDVRLCIVAMGVLCTLYTVLGGIEAVIWSDVLQVVVLIGGAIAALVIVSAQVDGGLEGVLAAAGEANKLRLVRWEWGWTEATVLVIGLGAVFNNLVPYTTDQAVVQRYLTTADERRSARAVWTGGLLAIPSSLLFFLIGTGLWAFYRQHPERLNPHGANDQVFAWFVVQELPAGLSGLVIAGVFAAAMSSLDSSMNSIATVLTTDFYRRLVPDAPDARCLRIARWITVVLGVLGTGAALLLAGADVRSLWDQFLAILGLLGGTLCGLFALGIFVSRASAGGALAGAGASFALLAWVRFGTDVSGLAYAGIGTLSCFVVGVLASPLMPDRGRDLRGLTLATLERRA